MYKNNLTNFVLIVITLVISFGILGLFSGSLMHLLGLQYTSVSMLILYFIIASIAAYITNFLMALFLILMTAFLGIELDAQNKTLLFSVDVLSSIIGFMVVDYCMTSITASNLSIIIISIILGILTFYPQNRKKDI